MPTDIYAQILGEYEAESRRRAIPPDRNGIPLIDLTTNDYMGLAKIGAAFMGEFHGRFGKVSMTSSASRLLAADQEIYERLENYLEQLYNRPALLFNSGYHANTGVISALSVPDTLWACDKLIHASMIDGIRLGRADYRRFAHNDVKALRRILETQSDKYGRIIVAVESVYSMDGDMAPLREIAALRQEFPKMMLYVDEAHALGVFGNKGAGKLAELGLTAEADIIIGTFGKACASSGAFAVCSGLLKEYIINSARSFIFSTAIAPANAAWTLLMLEALAEMDDRRRHLAEISRQFRDGIVSLTGEPNPSVSPIVPMMTGDARTALALSKALEEEGILALPIRRPTVPPGGERIRFSLHADMSESDVSRVIDTIGATLKRITRRD